MIKNFVRHAIAAGCCALTFGSTAIAQSIYEGPVDVTFKLRVKVEGNVEAINKGISVFCYLRGPGVHLARAVRVLDPGAVFVAETADGYIEREITLRDVQFDRSAFVDDPTRDLAARWRCTGAQYYEQYRAEDFLKEIGAGVYSTRPPAFIGTCSQARGALDLSGQVVDVTQQCATQ